MKLSNSQPASSPTTRTYERRYIARGKTSKFQLELSYGQLHDGGGFKVASGEGRFIAVPGSENAVLMQDLKSALLAKHVPGKVIRSRELRFDAVVLGEKQSENAGGGFSDKLPGDCIVLKLFLPKGGDEGEVFLNLNPVLSRGEFSIKDEDYGDYLLRQFAKVF